LTGPAVTLYLIHAEIRHGHAGHYLGVTTRDSLLPRMVEHLNGEGSILVQLFADAAGCQTAEQVIEKLVVAQWPGTRGEERRLKNRGGLGRVCPICRTARGLGPYNPNPNIRRISGTAQSNHQD